MHTVRSIVGRILLASGVVALSVLSLPVLAQETTQSAGASGTPGDAAASARFDVWEYRILGNTTLPNATIERAVYAHLGEGRSFTDVEAARASLERAYHGAGYGTVFVDIPEQEVNDGIVRLRVTEGRLDRVRVTGSRYFSNGRIRAALPGLAPGVVPNLPEVQAQIAAVNRVTGDRAITPVLKAGRTPGTVDVELKVSDEVPLHGGLEVNDRYTADTSRTRLTASLNYGNLFQREHSFSLQYQTAPQEPDEVQVFVGSYVFRLASMPSTTFAVYGVDSKTDVSALGTLSVIGNGNIYGLRAIQALPGSPSYSHSVTLGVDYKNFLEDIRLTDLDPLQTPIRYLNWSVDYSGARRSERSATSFAVTGGFGIRGLVNDSTQFADKRFLGAANYTYLRGNVQQSWALPLGFQVFGRVAGQFTQTPLVSNEQFGIGGADTVRGYLESAQLGDYGYHSTFELRSDSLARLLRAPLSAAHFLLFYDIGTVAVLEPLPSQAASFTLASWGAGMRISAWHGLDLAFDVARTLRPAGNTPAGDDRVHFTVRYGF